MRTPNDVKLAENCDEIDLILGGHDHVYEQKLINGKYVIKSGTDFRQFSKIVINFEKAKNGLRPEVSIEEMNVTAQYQEDPGLSEKLEKYTNIIQSKMDDVLGCFAVPLDGRFTSIRTSESNLGNWVSTKDPNSKQIEKSRFLKVGLSLQLQPSHNICFFNKNPAANSFKFSVN
ncbi:hypothetical protein HUJ05_012635 [Dendroctonus ponderosae]|nr:hypothetical protein HUJ05_012635 [Dendroctonus ponderosae]